MKVLKYLLFLVILASCVNENSKAVKIVDMKGNPARINKIVPKFNQEQLEKQRAAFNNAETQNINKFRQDYNDSQNFQPINQTTTFDDENIIAPSNKQYPNDIFADRITNYNYIQENQQISENKQREIPKNQVVEGDIVSNDAIAQEIKPNIEVKKEPVAVVEKKPAAPKKPKSNAKVNGKHFYIQIGIYSEKKNANVAYNKYSKINPGSIEEYNKNGKKYKVLLGPYLDRKNAEKDLEKVIKTGHYDVYITTKK